MRLGIISRVVGEVLVVNCSGRIVAGNELQGLHDHVKCASLETPDVVLHLEQVGFIDSSGMGMLVRLMTHARSRGGDLKLCVVPERILQTLSLTSLNCVFEIYASEGEAVAASYRRRQSEQNETFHSSRTVLCFEESADVCAYLRELLRHAGYSVLTTSMLRDAQTLLKAARPDLIVLGPGMVTVGERNTKELFWQVAPTVPVFILKEDFFTRDPGEAGVRLLREVSRFFPAEDATRH